jgi:hypothetical protein
MSYSRSNSFDENELWTAAVGGVLADVEAKALAEVEGKGDGVDKRDELDELDDR